MEYTSEWVNPKGHWSYLCAGRVFLAKKRNVPRTKIGKIKMTPITWSPGTMELKAGQLGILGTEL